MIILMGVFVFIAAICFAIGFNTWGEAKSGVDATIILAIMACGAMLVHIYVIAMLTYYRG